MKKILFILSLILCYPVIGCAQISQYDRVGGLNTSDPSYSIPATDFQDLQDVFTDNNGYIEVRGGLSTVYTTTGAIQQQYEFITLQNQRYRIIKSSAQLGYIDTDDTYKLLISTLPVNARLWKMSLRNECYLGTDQKTDRWQFTPTETTKLTISTYIPCGKYPIVAGDKAFMINISTPLKDTAPISQGGDESIVIYSKIGDLRNWGYTSGGTNQWLAINRNDGETLTGGFVQSGNLFVTKKHLLGSLVGIWNNDETDGERFVPLNTNIGSVSQDSVVTLNGKTYFASDAGEVEFNGTSYRIISRDVRDDIKSIVDNTGASVGSAIIYDNTALDFGAGTCVNVDTTTQSGYVTLPKGLSIINQQNALISQGVSVRESAEYYQTFMTSYTLQLSTISLYLARETGTTAPLQLSLKDNNNVLLASQTIQANTISTTAGWYPANLSSWVIYLTSGTTYNIVAISTGSTGYGWYGDQGVTQTSYQRGSSPDVWSYPDGDETIFNGGGDFAFRVYQFSYSTNKAGSFTSQKRQTTGWQQWGIMATNHEPTSSGDTSTNIQWFLSVATATVFCNTSNLARVTTGQVISLSSGTWVLWYASMTTTDICVSPKIDDVALYYTQDGQFAETTLVSYADELNNRLWISGIKDGSSINDVVYVWQGDTEKWTKLNLNARSFLKYNNKFYIGDSHANGYGAKIWEYSDDYTDDAGTAIVPYVRTPDFIPSGRAKDTKFGSLWVYSEPSTIYPDMTLTYYANKNTSPWETVTISQDAVTNHETMMIKTRVTSDLEFARFRMISFKFQNFSKLFGYDFYFDSYPFGEK